MCHLLHYVCFTGKSENLAETPILKDIFIFLANDHSFQKCSFLVEILSFLKEVFSVFKKCQILMALFPFGKKYHFMQKVLVFGQMSEFLVLKSSRAKLWGKVTSVFLNINFFLQNCQFFGKKIKILWEILTFSNNCALLVSVNILLENMLIFRKFWLFVWMSIYIKKLSNLIKTSIFLRKCLFVHVLIFIRVFFCWKIVILIQNMILFGDILENVSFS